MPFQALYPQRQLMLQRIGFFFLALVGTPQFLEMPTDDVIMLLQQNNLGVNSEIEVLYSCFRWISARPTQRAVLMRRLVECVRFTRLPLTMLRQLWRGFAIDGRPPHNPHCMVTSFHRDTIVQGRISDAITLVSLRRVYTDRDEFKQYCREKGLKVEAPREWMYDEDCPYHQPRPSAPYSHVVTASEFLTYIRQRAQAPREPPRTIPNLRAILPAPDGEEQHSSSSSLSPSGDDISNTGDHIAPAMESASEPDDWEEYGEVGEFLELESINNQSSLDFASSANNYDGPAFLQWREPHQSDSDDDIVNAGSVEDEPMPEWENAQDEPILEWQNGQDRSDNLTSTLAYLENAQDEPILEWQNGQDRSDNLTSTLADLENESTGIDWTDTGNMGGDGELLDREYAELRDNIDALAIQHYEDQEEEEKEEACPACYVADLLRMCRAQGVDIMQAAIELQVPAQAEIPPQDRVVPMESYLQQNAQTIAHLLSAINDNDT
ncbi:hypothetical protein KR018_008645 [Drosophila ironensis]|nr:hypothetical protein KR018_008645 [Drosophila ironensis]